MADMTEAEIETRVASAARVLCLSDYLHRRPAPTRGQRLRIAIGRAIVREP
jgi:ABC-type sugar transport system ATPase subunit